MSEKKETNTKDKDQEVVKKTSSGISYSGSVQIKYRDKNGRIRTLKQKNAGEEGLFRFLLYSLQGSNAAVNFKPIELCGFYTDSSNNWNRSFSRPIPLRGTPQIDLSTEDKPSSITFSFLIPNSTLVTTSNPIKILLLTNSQYTYQNHTPLDRPDPTKICASLTDLNIPTNLNSNIIVYWKMTFSNPS